MALGARFCSTCGASDARPRPRAPSALAERLLTTPGALLGERKHITVLFADLQSSLELMSGRDPEEVRRLLDPVIERMVEAVHRYDGTVNQVMGDGIMALFGAPVAQEDHAVRACHAALDMHAAIARQTQARDPGSDVRIRIGINSGDVVLRFVDSDLRQEYAAVGLTTHVAARMEQLATPGTTLMTGATRRLAEGHVEVRALGPTAVRGLGTPMDVYELVGASPARTRFEAARAGWQTRFVGRGLEIAALRRAAERSGSGRGQVVAMVGEPGIGKSRLVHEFTRRHLPGGWVLLETGALAYGPAHPYLPIATLLRRIFDVEEHEDAIRAGERVSAHVRALDGGSADLLAPLLDLLGVAPDDDARRRLEPLQRRSRLLDAVVELLVREARAHPRRCGRSSRRGSTGCPRTSAGCCSAPRSSVTMCRWHCRQRH